MQAGLPDGNAMPNGAAMPSRAPSPAACLFDLDGLLLDTEPCHGRAWREAAAAFGLALAPEQLMAMRGRRRLDCVELVRGWIGANGAIPPSADDLLAVQQPIARRLLPDAPAMVGAPELVAMCLERRLATALVTSSSREAVALKSSRHPWLEAITVRVHGDDPELAAGKPHPDPFLLAARRLGQEPGHCWAFEDSPAGAHAAHAAGCRVHVLTPPGAVRKAYPADVRWLSSLREVTLAP